MIDEIDKAPRDFPNDLLNELDHLWFRVPELARWTETPETPRGAIAREHRPIVVITSNLERQLPDAFLRRCVFHHIAHPADEATLKTIVSNCLKREALRVADEDVARAIRLFLDARQHPLDKRPGLAEFIEFVRAIGLRADEFSGQPATVRAAACLPALIKTTRDMETLTKHLSG